MASEGKDDGKKETEEARKVWIVTFTYFTDDYKPRGGDWSRTEGPYLFDTEESAWNFTRRELAEWCYEQIYGMGYDEDEQLADWRERYKKIYYGHELEGNNGHDLTDIEDLAEEISSQMAKYVARVFRWSVTSDKVGSCPSDFTGIPEPDDLTDVEDEDEEDEEGEGKKDSKAETEPGTEVGAAPGTEDKKRPLDKADTESVAKRARTG